MDNRLGLVSQRRPSRLRKTDLPNLAEAITVYQRRLVEVGVTRAIVCGASVVTLSSKTFRVSVLSDDWAKIDPYFRDDTFDVLKYPPVVGYSVFQPSVTYSPALVRSDPLYQRVLNVLLLLFPEEYPTSDY